MSKPTSAVKRKYNKSVYDRHEFSVNKDTLLAHKINEYKTNGSLSNLIKELLANHFDVNPNDTHVAYYYGKDENGKMVLIPNPIQ